MAQREAETVGAEFAPGSIAGAAASGAASGAVGSALGGKRKPGQILRSAAIGGASGAASGAVTAGIKTELGIPLDKPGSFGESMLIQPVAGAVGGVASARLSGQRRGLGRAAAQGVAGAVGSAAGNAGGTALADHMGWSKPPSQPTRDDDADPGEAGGVGRVRDPKEARRAFAAGQAVDRYERQRAREEGSPDDETEEEKRSAAQSRLYVPRRQSLLGEGNAPQSPALQPATGRFLDPGTGTRPTAEARIQDYQRQRLGGMAMAAVGIDRPRRAQLQRIGLALAPRAPAAEADPDGVVAFKRHVEQVRARRQAETQTAENRQAYYRVWTDAEANLTAQRDAAMARSLFDDGDEGAKDAPRDRRQGFGRVGPTKFSLLLPEPGPNPNLRHAAYQTGPTTPGTTPGQEADPEGVVAFKRHVELVRARHQAETQTAENRQAYYRVWTDAEANLAAQREAAMTRSLFDDGAEGVSRDERAKDAPRDAGAKDAPRDRRQGFRRDDPTGLEAWGYAPPETAGETAAPINLLTDQPLGTTKNTPSRSSRDKTTAEADPTGLEAWGYAPPETAGGTAAPINLLTDQPLGTTKNTPSREWTDADTDTFLRSIEQARESVAQKLRDGYRAAGIGEENDQRLLDALTTPFGDSAPTSVVEGDPVRGKMRAIDSKGKEVWIDRFDLKLWSPVPDPQLRERDGQGSGTFEAPRGRAPGIHGAFDVLAVKGQNALAPVSGITKINVFSLNQVNPRTGEVLKGMDFYTKDGYMVKMVYVEPDPEILRIINHPDRSQRNVPLIGGHTVVGRVQSVADYYANRIDGKPLYGMKDHVHVSTWVVIDGEVYKIDPTGYMRGPPDWYWGP